MPVPEELDWAAAGGVPEVFTTAHDALFTQAGLRVGERLLVHGAAGGVGMAARAARRDGRRARDRDGAQRARREQIAALGVNAIEPEGFEEHGPFDVILELVGAPNLPGNLDALAERGRICVIGVGAGAKAEINLRAADGQARPHPRLDAARALARGQGGRRAAGGEDGAARLRLRRPQRAGQRDLPARRRADGLRPLPGRASWARSSSSSSSC